MKIRKITVDFIMFIAYNKRSYYELIGLVYFDYLRYVINHEYVLLTFRL